MGYRNAVLSLSAAVLIAPFAATGTASADAIADSAAGTYTIEWKPDVPAAKWVFTPCDDDAPRCVAINQYLLTDSQLKKPQFIGKAFWNVGAWVMVTDEKNLITCKESGEKFNFPATWAWDAATNAGSRSYLDPGLCGGENKGKDVTSKFTLKKVSSDAPAAPTTPAPAPSPVAPAPAPTPAPAAEAPAPAAQAVPAAPTPAPGAAESTAPPPAA